MTLFVCEDSLDGILTGVYEAWDSRLGHNNVKLKTETQDTLELFCEYRYVQTELEKAEKVLRTVHERLGEAAREAICYAAACPESRKADAIYRMIVLGLHMPRGREVVNCLQNPDVQLVMKLRQRAWHEAHRMLGFLRFEELETGILYGKYSSPCAVLPLIAPHFAERYRQENWVIHDLDRGLLAIHRKETRWVIWDAAELKAEGLERYSKEEGEFRELWKTFCKSVMIKERRNPRCQQNFLPLRCRPYMTEFEAEEKGLKLKEKN